MKRLLSSVAMLVAMQGSVPDACACKWAAHCRRPWRWQRQSQPIAAPAISSYGAPLAGGRINPRRRGGARYDPYERYYGAPAAAAPAAGSPAP